MNRIYLALVTLAFSGAALAVDITLTLTPQHMNRAQAAVGQVLMLRTPGTPGTPGTPAKAAVLTNGVVTTPAVAAVPAVPAVPGVLRDATNTEVEKYLADQLRAVIRQYERGKKIDAAQTEADALPTVDIQ